MLGLSERYGHQRNGNDCPGRAICRLEWQVGERNSSHGFVTFDWVETVPHSSYLTSIAVGPWHKFSDIASGIPVEYYAAENVDEATVRRSFHLTPDVIGFFFHALEIHFPYEKYAQVAVENDMSAGRKTSAQPQ